MSGEKVEVLPGALYTVRETAELLGFGKRPGTIYEIPETELVPTWVGPRRGKKMFLGADIIAYRDQNRPKGAPKIALAS